jgi:hypothetical protein
MKTDKRKIMQRAWTLRRQRGLDALNMGEAMKLAWAEARNKPIAQAIQPTLIVPPLVSAGRSAVALARRISRSKIELGLQVQVKAVARITPTDGMAETYILDKIGGGAIEYDARR